MTTDWHSIGPGAIFSPNKNYRFSLWRRWNDKPMAMFIGLNPSTANEKKDDPTIRRVTRFAFDFGCGGFFMMNLFAFVTPYPSHLPEGRGGMETENDLWLDKASLESDRVIYAWGAFGQPKWASHIKERADAIIQHFPGAYCLGKTKEGYPKHPLYLSSDTKLEVF